MKETIFEQKETITILIIAFLVMGLGVFVAVGDLKATNRNNQLTGQVFNEKVSGLDSSTTYPELEDLYNSNNLGSTSGWGNLGTSIWGEENEPWLESVAELGDYLDLDEWAKDQCTYPFDYDTPNNILFTEEGDIAFLLEATTVYHETYLTCSDKNDTYCEEEFGAGFGCYEGVCSDAYGQNIPTKEYTVYLVEIVIDAVNLVKDGSIMFDVIANPGSVKLDYNGDGNVTINDTIILTESSASVSKTGSNGILIREDGDEKYTYACLRFATTTPKLEKLLEEYNSDSTNFCTTFESKPDRVTDIEV